MDHAINHLYAGFRRHDEICVLFRRIVMRRDLRLLLLEIAVPLLLLGAAELAARWYVQHGPVPILPRFFPFPITTGKYVAYRELAGTSAPLDVLLMGMSPMLRVNAGKLADRVTEELHRPVHVFNFSAPLQTVAFDHRLLQDILLKIKRPRVVVFGVMPINLLHDERPAQTESFVRVSPIFMAFDDTIAGHVYGALLEHVHLIRFREVIRDQVMSPSSTPTEEFVQMAQNTDARGDIPFVAPDAPVVKLTAWEHDYKRTFRDFDSIMQSTLLFEHLGALARLCAEHGVGFMLVNNAVHPMFLELFPHGQADYNRFLFRLRNVASEAHVPLCEPADDGIGPPDLFQDTHHHNVRGSRWLTQHLTACLLQAGLLGAPTT